MRPIQEIAQILARPFVTKDKPEQIYPDRREGSPFREFSDGDVVAYTNHLDHRLEIETEWIIPAEGDAPRISGYLWVEIRDEEHYVDFNTSHSEESMNRIITAFTHPQRTPLSIPLWAMK